MEIHRKKTEHLAPRFLRSLKILGSNTDRSGTYDFQLTFYSDHGPILYRFYDTVRYWPEIAIFLNPR